MKSKQTCLIVGVLLLLIFTFTGLAGAQILTNASQMVNLVANGVTIGSGGTYPNGVPLTNLSSQNPDGSSTANWSIPSGKVLVVTKMKYSFKLTSGTFTNSVILAIGPYYTKRFTVQGTTTSTAADSDNIPTGFVINGTGWVATNYISVYYANDATKTPLVGTLSFEMLGFTAPNQ